MGHSVIRIFLASLFLGDRGFTQDSLCRGMPMAIGWVHDRRAFNPPSTAGGN